MTSAKRPRGSDTVAQFPPLPRLPPPPRSTLDPRQRTAAHIIGAIADLARPVMHVAGPNLVTGFHASAVDVGQLQSALERGLNRFDDAQLASRQDEVFTWIRRVLGSWVQRCKQMRVERHESGIRVEIETQDDLGYYSYGFDVFPRRSVPRPRTSPRRPR